MATCYAFAPLDESSSDLDDALSTLSARDWVHESDLSSPGDGRRVLLLSREFDSPEEAARAGADLPELLGGAWNSDPVDTPELLNALPPGVLALLPTKDSIGTIKALLGSSLPPIAVETGSAGDAVVVETSPAAGSPAGSQAAPAAKGKQPRSAKKAAAANGSPNGSTGPAPGADLAAKGLEALAVPEPVWADVPDPNRGPLVESVLADLFQRRGSYAETVRWSLAPERELLGRTDPARQEALAERLLLARAGLAKHQLAREETRNSLEDQRVQLVAQAVAIASEMNSQFAKWRKIAGWGVGILIATVIFAAVAGAYVLYWAAHDAIDDWAAATLIFVLALFAASPAVLLLRERPLKGIDEWMPGEKAAAGEDEKADESKDEGQTKQTIEVSLRPQTGTPTSGA